MIRVAEGFRRKLAVACLVETIALLQRQKVPLFLSSTSHPRFIKALPKDAVLRHVITDATNERPSSSLYYGAIDVL